MINVHKNYWLSAFESFGPYLSFGIKKNLKKSIGKNLEKNGKGLDSFFFVQNFTHRFLMGNERYESKDHKTANQNNFCPENSEIYAKQKY